MKAIVVATTLMSAILAAAVEAGVAPTTGTSQMSQSGAKVAPSKNTEAQPQAEADQQQEKPK